MAVKVCCPSCNKSLLAPDAAPSRKGKCPQCGSEFQVANAVLSNSVEPEFKLDTGRVPSSNHLTPRQPPAIPQPVLSAPSSTEYSPPARIENTNESRIACPECSSPLRVATAALGGPAKCPQCGAVFVIARDFRPPSIEYVSQAASQPAYQSPSPATQVGDCPFRQSSPSTASVIELTQGGCGEQWSTHWLFQAAIVGTPLLFGCGALGAGNVPSGGTVWLLAALSTIAGVALMYRVLRPTSAIAAHAAIPFLITAFVGLGLLLIFQNVAELAKGLDQRTAGSPRITILYWIIKLIGHAYDINRSFLSTPDHGIPFLVGLFATIFSNGLCEELVKLAPAAYLIVTKKDLQYRDALFIGAASGVGFGVGEGLHYASNVYAPSGASMSIYLQRFTGIAWSHGVYTIISTAAAFAWRDTLRDATKSKSAGWEIGVMLASCSLVSSIPHAFYNCLSQVHTLLGVVVDFVTVYFATQLAFFVQIGDGHYNSSAGYVPNVTSENMIVAEVADGVAQPSTGRSGHRRSLLSQYSHGVGATKWFTGCLSAVGLAGLVVILTIVATRQGPAGGEGKARIRVTGRDGTSELQTIMREPAAEEITRLRVKVMVYGMDIYAATVRIENVGNVPVLVTPHNISVHLGAQSTGTGVISSDDLRFLRRSTLRPGEYIEGLVMYLATPSSVAALRPGAGGLSYQDASIEVVY